MKKFFAMLLAVAMVLSLAACGSSASTDTASTDTAAAADTTAADDTAAPAEAAAAPAEDAAAAGDTTVTIGTTEGDYSCYPPSSYDNDFLKQAMVYDKLFEVDDTTGEYVSRVLESYEWTDDVTLHMTLKSGITFSDGNEMTMEDVLYTMQCFMSSETTDKYSYYKYIDFDKTTVSDDGMSMDLVWTTTYGPALRELNMSIIEKSFAEQYEETDPIWFTAPVGSGPYVISDYVADAYVTFTLREDYWDTDYTYDATQITLKFYTDENAEFIDYQNGSLDAMYNVGTTVASQVQADASLGTLELVSDNNTVIMILNQDNEALKDPVVREAICMAIDRDYITEVCYGILGTAATDLWATSFSCYVDHDSALTYDPDTAHQMLLDAGYKDGDISLKWICPTFDPQPLIGECIQSMLSQIGINVSVESYELSTALGYHCDGTTDISNLTCQGGNPTMEPDQFISSFCSGAAFQAFTIEDADYNEYYQTGLTSVDSASRDAAYQGCSEWLISNHYIVPLTENLKGVVYNSRIADFPQATVGRSCLGSLKLA